MCLIAWNWQPQSDTPLLLVGNRDEFYARPAQAMHWWADGMVLAGKDLQAGGTWLGLNRNGRLAVLTNYRSTSALRADAPSRGELVAGFLSGTQSASTYLSQLAPNAQHYNPFNLLLFDGTHLLGLESRTAKVLEMAPGINAVSNADFGTPWPKLVRWTQALAQLEQTAQGTEVPPDTAYLRFMQDRQQASDTALPSTGIARERERALSAAFITTPDYGTRACSIVRMGRTHARVSEYSFDGGGATGQVQFEWDFCKVPGHTA